MKRLLFTGIGDAVRGPLPEEQLSRGYAAVTAVALFVVATGFLIYLKISLGWYLLYLMLFLTGTLFFVLFVWALSEIIRTTGWGFLNGWF